MDVLHNKRRFAEAQAAKRELASLNRELDNRRIQQLKDAQWNEILTAEETHYSEFQELSAYWDQQLTAWQQRRELQTRELEDRHDRSVSELIGYLEQSIPLEPRLTSDILNLLRIEQNLIKTKEYEEAKKVGKRIKTLRNEEREKWEVHRRRKIESEYVSLVKRQQVESHALEVRLQSEYNDLVRSRTQQIERFLLKCQNVKHEQNTQHKMHLQRMISTRRSERHSTS